LPTAAPATASSSSAPAPSPADDAGPGVEEHWAADVIAEADVLLAYGLHSQAGDLVRGAVRRDAGNMMLMEKLLEVHFAAGNPREFAEAARTYQASLREHADFWSRTVAMGRRLCPGDTLFAGITDRAREATDAVDFEAALPGGSGSPAPLATTDNLGVELDFELGAPNEEAPAADEPTVRAATLSDAAMLGADAEPEPGIDIDADEETVRAASLVPGDDDDTARVSTLSFDTDGGDDYASTVAPAAAAAAGEATAAHDDGADDGDDQRTIDAPTLVFDKTAEVVRVDHEDDDDSIGTQTDTLAAPASVMIGDHLITREADPVATDGGEGKARNRTDATTVQITMNRIGLVGDDGNADDSKNEPPRRSKSRRAFGE
jgi:hypothetical protein